MKFNLRMIKKILFGFFGIIILLVFCSAVRPVVIDPLAFNPPSFPLVDSSGQTNWLTSAIEKEGSLRMGSNLNNAIVKYKINQKSKIN